MSKTLSNPRNLAKMALCVALICVSAYIIIPLPFTPIPLAAMTCAMGFTALILSPKETAIVMFVYILLGAVGIPVFSAGRAGLGFLMGPAGGFYPSFLVAYTIVSAMKGRSINFKRYAAVGILCIPLTYVGGVISMVTSLGININEAMVMAVYPFIVGDVIKCIVAAALAVRVNKVINRQ